MTDTGKDRVQRFQQPDLAIVEVTLDPSTLTATFGVVAPVGKAAGASSPRVIVDRPHLRAVFRVFGGPRGLSRAIVRDAYKPLLRSRAER